MESNGTAIIPFAALSKLLPADSGAFVNLFIASMASPRQPVLAGGGFGRVPAKGTHKFDVEVIAPATPKQHGPTIVVLPAIYAKQSRSASKHRVWYEFPAADFRRGYTMTGGKAFTAPRTAEGLIADVQNMNYPVWRRRLSLNWLAEDFPVQSAEPLIEAVRASENPAALRLAAITNIGLGKISGCGPLLAGLVESNADLRPAAMTALGRLGDPAHAAVVRKALSSSDVDVRRIAIEALSSMKDKESLPALMALLNTKDKSADSQLISSAATGVAKIGGESAYPELLALAMNSKLPERTRVAVLDSFPAGVPDTVVDGISKLLSKEKRANMLTRSAAEAVGRAGSASALAALADLARNGREDLAEDAIRALTRNKDAEWRKTSIGLAASADNKNRAQTIYYLGLFEAKEAAAMMREAAITGDAKVSSSACRALQSLKETPPPNCK